MERLIYKEPKKIYMKFGLKKGDVLEINRALGGNLRSESSLDFAFTAAAEKSDRRKLALLWRAILIDHPFDDANKRTVAAITRLYAQAKGLKIEPNRLAKEILNVSKNNIHDLKTVERRIKYATTGN